jgi:hypothetical protein
VPRSAPAVNAVPRGRAGSSTGTLIVSLLVRAPPKRLLVERSPPFEVPYGRGP